jgi:hypothetical protein
LALGHEVQTFAYRRANPLYKNAGTKAAYQLWILRRLERLCLDWRPDLVLVVKGGPITPGVIRRVKARLDTLFVNFFPDNPLWMIPFDHIEAYDVFSRREKNDAVAARARRFHHVPALALDDELRHPGFIPEPHGDQLGDASARFRDRRFQQRPARRVIAAHAARVEVLPEPRGIGGGRPVHQPAERCTGAVEPGQGYPSQQPE